VPPREPSAYRLAKLVKRARRQMTNALRERLEPMGTSLPVIQIMKRVVEEGALNQLDLARKIELEPSALCRIVVELESRRLVVRTRDPQDNRRVLVSATPAGETLLRHAQPHMRAGLETMASRLTRAERTELCRLLEKLVAGEV
jgi:MarR family transcriptional regulator, lower aerobic nicotinate degradation pathway regulator